MAQWFINYRQVSLSRSEVRIQCSKEYEYSTESNVVKSEFVRTLVR